MSGPPTRTAGLRSDCAKEHRRLFAQGGPMDEPGPSAIRRRRRTRGTPGPIPGTTRRSGQHTSVAADPPPERSPGHSPKRASDPASPTIGGGMPADCTTAGAASAGSGPEWPTEERDRRLACFPRAPLRDRPQAGVPASQLPGGGLARDRDATNGERRREVLVGGILEGGEEDAPPLCHVSTISGREACGRSNSASRCPGGFPRPRWDSLGALTSR